MNKEAYYKPSGKISGLYILLFLLCSVISIPILSFAYIYLNYYIPIIYILFFITIGCGAIFGYLMSIAAKLGKARNPAVVIGCTLIGTALFKYVQWCFYIPLVLNKSYEVYYYSFGQELSFLEQVTEAFYFFIEPAAVLDGALFINEYGVWGIGNSGDTVAGIFLAIVWLVEFLVIAGMASLMCRDWPGRPYSEESNGWYTQMETIYEMDSPANFDGMKISLESGNVEEFIALLREGVSNPLNFLRLTFFKPPAPSHTEPYYMNIDHIFVDDKNKDNTATLVNYLAVSTHNANAIFTAEPIAQTYEETPVYEEIEDTNESDAQNEFDEE